MVLEYLKNWCEKQAKSEWCVLCGGCPKCVSIKADKSTAQSIT